MFAHWLQYLENTCEFRRNYSGIARTKLLGLPFRMRVSHLESAYGTRYTVDFLERLTARHPNHRFVYMIGADNLGQMQRWKNWRKISRNPKNWKNI